ncbi:MAG: hypothetical protein EXQ74_07120 [Thermoleophilia bacterium]|nr:hypothetical protein [Thermoleophilia bacterium]
MDDDAALVHLMLGAAGVDIERRGPRDWSLRVPCTTRGIITVGVHAGERTLAFRAFFMRGPDHALREVYRRAMRKNLEMQAWRFATDDSGDLWLITEVESVLLDADGLDGLLGLLSTYVDETFQGILRLGFNLAEGLLSDPPPPVGGGPPHH